jgi:hypothetical protein
MLIFQRPLKLQPAAVRQTIANLATKVAKNPTVTMN